MKPYINPLFLIRLAQIYLSDVNRLWNYNEQQLKKYQDTQFRRIVNYAYTVPLYHDKFKKHHIHPSEIKGIDDLHKLPFITKKDLRNNYPKGLVPKNFNHNDSFTISTSGSTGKPVFIIIDRLTAIRNLLGFVRSLKAYGGDWKKSKVALIIDTDPGSAENAIFSEGLSFVNKLMKVNNIKYIHLGEKPEKIIKILDSFQPEYLGSDPNMLRQLSILKSEDMGKNVNPKYLMSSGSMLDISTKQFIEKSFNRRVLDLYGTTEGGPLSFECIDYDYHIHSDYVKIEFLDEENQPVSYGKPGHTIITKLYGSGTPIIRYKGIDDIAIPIKKETSCGITSEMIKKIEGRASELIYLPNGKTLSPLALTGIPAKTMEYFNSYQINQFQIIQHAIDAIEILVIIEEKKDKNIESEHIINELKKRFTQKIGQDVNITVTQTDTIQKDTRSDYVKVIISKISKKDNFKK